MSVLYGGQCSGKEKQSFASGEIVAIYAKWNWVCYTSESCFEFPEFVSVQIQIFIKKIHF